MRPSALTVVPMEMLSDGLVTLGNGVYVTLGFASRPAMLFVLVSALSLTWIARLEVAALDRRAAKPEIGRH